MRYRLAVKDLEFLARLLREGGEAQAVSVPSSAVAWIALALHELSGRTVVLVTDGPRTMDVLFRDVETLSACEGLRPPAYYPAWESLPGHGAPPHADLIGDRLATLRAFRASHPPPVVVTCVQALMQRALPAERLMEGVNDLRAGRQIRPADLLSALERAGYVFASEVSQKGEASLRGGIVDFWPPTREWPVRAEFFGDQIDSLREFDPATQRSVGRVESIECSPALEPVDQLSATFFDHVPANALFVWHGRESIDHHAAMYDNLIREAAAEPYALFYADVQIGRRAHGTLCFCLTAGTDPAALHLFGATPFEGSPEARPDLPPDQMERERLRVLMSLASRAREGYAVRIHFATPGARERFAETYGHLLEPAHAFELTDGGLSEGFDLAEVRLLILSEEDIYGRRKEARGRYDIHRRRGGRRYTGERIADWTDLHPGDYVVHVDHGIGKYLGLFDIQVAGQMQEALAIEYADNARLYIPVSQSHLLTRYTGAGRARPTLHALGGKRWAREKEAAQKAVADLAAQLLETQARRDALPGFAFGKDTPWQYEFEAAFPFQETEDQERAIEDVKRDMESQRPMDRLVCGDVGYGKTEVAMRAAFKAVMSGKQVAVLVPTTVLAQQHYDTFCARMAAFPVRIGMLSRFQSRREQADIVRRANEGSIDIVIGTHRLLQGDVVFKDLGLLIIDEEHRFGVAHKEFLKRTHAMVDVLTLTATPIPRTLYMSLSGVRDLSVIATPPQERLPVETIVAEISDELVREAILRELNREGQVFYLYNRVRTMDRVLEWLERLVPEARIRTAHGQMPEDELADVMRAFTRGEFDVLLCTTIIESGLDLPNVNTILIERSDRFGLAELYQLRGRVGRYKRKAYAYFLLPRHGHLLAEARKRLSAIRRYSQLGAGFRLAMRDLEIRGAGNLLGPQQSGHISAVGFDLYCQLLRRSIARLIGEPAPPVIDCELRLDFIDLSPGAADDDGAAVLPAHFIDDEALRIRVYRQIASASSLEELEQARKDLEDRFGRLPPAVDRLLKLAALRIFASLKGIRQIEVKEDRAILSFAPERYFMPGGRFPRLRGRTASEKLEELMNIVKVATRSRKG